MLGAAIVFGVTLVTLLTQALPFRRFLAWLGVAGRPESREIDQSRAVLTWSRYATDSRSVWRNRTPRKSAMMCCSSLVLS